MKTTTQLIIHTEHGDFIAMYSGRGLRALDFPNGKRRSPASNTGPVEVRRWHTLTSRALKRVLAGKPADELPPLDLSEGTAFQRAVWTALRKIPAGRTNSYGEIARSVGKPRAARAVGAACGANPIPVLVPCHRVLAGGGGLGGFTAGLDWKRTLLAREGVNAR